MDHQWGLARTAAAQQQQGDVASQYSYSSSSYPGQQAGTPSPATSAMYAQPQGYSQQTYIQQTYAQQQATAASAQVGYGSNANNHGAISTGAHMSAQQQQQVAWSQQASVQGAQQADQSQGTYGRSATGLTPVMGTGTVSAATAATIQYAGQYGAIYAAAPAAQPSGQQAPAGIAQGVISNDDYQAKTVATCGSTVYGAPQDSRATIASGASYVVGGASSGSASDVYATADDATYYAEISKYGDTTKFGEMAKFGETPKYGGTASTAGYGGKSGEYGGPTSPTAPYSLKAAAAATTAEQYGASYTLKSSNFQVAERVQCGQTQSAYGQVDSQGDSARHYQDAHVTAAVSQQRQEQQSQILQQQQALQAPMVMQTAVSSPLDSGTRTQQEYVGRFRGIRGGACQEYGGNPRGMITSGNFGAGRGEVELITPFGVGGGGRTAAGSAAAFSGSQQSSMYGGMTGGKRLRGQMYSGHTAPGMGYGGVQLPPGRDYNAGQGAGGGFPGHREVGHGAGRGTGGGGSRSDRPSIGSSHNEDCRDQRPPFRGIDRHFDDNNRRQENRERGHSSSSNQVGIGGGRDGGPGRPGGGTGNNTREDRERGRDRDRDQDRRDDQRKRDQSPGLWASHDHKMSPAGNRDNRSWKESSRHDSLHRHMSPSKDKRREYICKIKFAKRDNRKECMGCTKKRVTGARDKRHIEPYSLVEPERDYLSICKRYSKLYVVPDFSKLIVCWIGKDVDVPLSLSISFEHEAVDIDDEVESSKEAPPSPPPPPNISNNKVLPSSASSAITPTPTSSKLRLQTTIWNAKVMLMSGLTVGAFAKFLSEKTTELDKPFHLHNLLKFVALRKDRSAIMAAGGTWDPEVDGGDPAIDDTALIRAVIRCTKDSTQLDLSACKVWTRFLEVHYERLGGDGLPSHKEITVIFFPTLFDCVPSPEVWQTQWIERQQAKLKLEAASKEEKEAPTEEVEVSEEGDSNGVKHEKEEVATAVQEDVTVDNEIKVDDGKRKLSEDKITAVQQNGATQVLLPKVKEQVIVKEEEVPLPGFVLTTKQTKTFKMRSMTISLDGLLDYDEEDREECTFELSLFAEVFQEFLQFKMGTRILSNLEMLRQNSYARWKQERKHKSDNKKEMDAEGSSSHRKRSKFSDKLDVVVMKAEVEVRIEASLKTEDQPKRVEQNGIEGKRTKDNMSNNIKKEPVVVDSQDADICSNVHVETKEAQIEGTHCIMETKDMDAEMTEAAATTDPILEEKLKDHKVETRMVVDEELLLAYCYFDKNKVGYLKSDDIRRLLHSLGMFLSHRIIKELVVSAVLESNKNAQNDRITYRCFTAKEVEVDTTLAAG